MDFLNCCIEHHGKTVPDRIALVFGKYRYTYRELANQIESLARVLEQHGLGAGMRISLQLPHSDAGVIGLFAILRTGACAVSLNPLLHPKELVALCDDAEVSGMLITSKQYQSLQQVCFDRGISSLKTVLVLPDDVFSVDKAVVIQTVGSFSEALPDTLPEVDDAMIVYTSGTSGKAKGVVLTHQNLRDKAQVAAEVMAISKDDRALMTLPLCHVFGLTRQLLPHFLQGASVQIVAASAPPDLLNYLIEAHSITTFSGVPYHYHGMLQRGAGAKYPMTSLRLATSSSMRLHGDLRRKLARALPHVSFSAQYGLTETSGFVTALSPEFFLEKSDSVGRCIPGVEAKVVVSNLTGISGIYGEGAGELLVRGCGIMSRYFKHPDATAATLDEGGWLKTGDLASIDTDGDVMILSRKQFLIKRAGEFIIPEEVEAVIASHEAVDEVCVFGVPDVALGESVGAAVVLNRETTSNADILEHCRRNLAGFKIPKEIIVVDVLERTHTGKINKNTVVQHYMASVARSTTA